MKKILCFLAAFFPTLLPATSLTLSEPTAVCGFPHVIAKTGNIIIKKRLEKPAAGDTSFFIYEDITASTPVMMEVAFNKLREEGGIVVYAELSEIEAGQVTDNDAAQIIDALLYTTPAQSVNPNKGILANEIDIFGPLPDVDDNGKLFVLLTDIRDDYDEEDNPVYVAGYFDPRDQIRSSGDGNFGDILYIDTSPAEIYDKFTLGIVAHELQHLIHYGVDDDESTWLNEGMSEFAMYILGFESRSYGTFLRDTNRPLTSFDNSIADYAKVGLWTLYCYQQFGLEFIKDVVEETANSLDSYARALADNGLALNTDDLMRNWFVANLINDSDIADGVFGYGDVQISAVYSDYFYGSFDDNETVDLSVKNSAAQYIQFFAGKGLRFDMNFTADSDFKMAVVKEGSETVVEFADLGDSPFHYEEPSFGITYNKLTFIPYWTKISSLDRNKSLTFSAQLIGGVEETEIVYDDELAYYIQLNYAKAAEKFTAPGDVAYRLAGVKFNVAGDAAVTIRIYESLYHYPVATYDLVPGAGEWTNYYLPNAVPLPESQEIYIAVESSDRNQSLGYSATGEGLGRAYLDIGAGYRDLNNYEVNSASLDGDWMIGAILHNDIAVAADFDVSPKVLYFWENEYSKQFEIRNLGSGSIDWRINSPLPDWLTLSATAGAGLTTLQKITATINRSILEPGLYNQLLTIASSAGSDSVLISVIERNLFAPQTGLFCEDMSFSSSVVKKSMQIVNIGSGDAEFLLKTDDPALAFIPDAGIVGRTDTVVVDALIDPANVQNSRISFSFYNGIDTITYAFSYSDSVTAPDEKLKLFPVIPNPYLAASGGPAQIRFRLIDAARAVLGIYNIRGEKIRELKLSNPETGLHVYAWDGKNRQGRRVSSGVYFIVLQQHNKTATEKMLLLK